MKNGFIGFVLGGAVCGVGAWFFTKKKYMTIAQKAVDDYEDYVANSLEESTYEEEPDVLTDISEDEEIEDEKRIQEEAEDAEDELKDHINDVKILPPHRIDEMQLGETGYDREYYTIFSDGILADDYGDKEDPTELLGDELYHNLLEEMKDLTPDDLIPEVCVRNDEHEHDMVISLDNTITFDQWINDTN